MCAEQAERAMGQAHSGSPPVTLGETLCLGSNMTREIRLV